MDFERGLQTFGELVHSKGNEQDKTDFALYQGQLSDNLRKDKRFGSSENLRNERAAIADNLNTLALRLTGGSMSFTDMCLGKTPTIPPPGGGSSAGGGGQQQQQQQSQSQQVNVHVYSGPSSPGGGGGGSTAGGGGEWDAAAIRELLTVALSAGELNDLCFDHFATVYHTFDEGMGRDQKIRALVGHCSRQGDAAMHKLLAEVQRLNPSRYAEYEPRLRQ